MTLKTELIALTKLYLLQQYSLKDFIFCDKAEMDFFRPTREEVKTQIPKPAILSPAAIPIPIPKPTVRVNNEVPEPLQKVKTPPIAIESAPKTPTTDFNLKTAIQGDKVMQDFESGSFAMGVDQSQKVKATPIANDYGSKDCVNLSPSIAVSRFKEIRSLISQLYPKQALTEHVPEPFSGVVILTAQTQPDPLLVNLCKAIQSLAPAQILPFTDLEMLLKKGTLRLILVCKSEWSQFPELNKGYREVDGKPFFNSIPVRFLLDPSQYSQELKTELWKELKERLKAKG